MNLFEERIQSPSMKEFSFTMKDLFKKNARVKEQSSLLNCVSPAKKLDKAHTLLPFLWDNWLVDLGKEKDPLSFGRFSLEAPRNEDPLSRHGNSKIAFYLKSAEGGYFKLCNVVNQAPSWSGSALNLSKENQEKCLDRLSVTEQITPSRENLRRANREALLNFKETAMVIPCTIPLAEKPKGYEHLFRPQSISLVYKKAGELSFKKHGIILNPFEMKDENLKYYKIDASRHVISAWRDPYIMYEDGKFHLFFSARYSEEFYKDLPEAFKKKHAEHPVYQQAVAYDEEVNSVIGYAVSENLVDWKLMKPLSVNANATQFELPVIIKQKDGYLLMIVVSDGSVAIDEPEEGLKKFGERHQYLLGFKTQNSLDKIGDTQAWTSLEQDINQHTQPLKDIYGMTFKPINNQVYAVAYHEQDYTLTDIVKVDGQGFPLNFPSEKHRLWKTKETIV